MTTVKDVCANAFTFCYICFVGLKSDVHCIIWCFYYQVYMKFQEPKQVCFTESAVICQNVFYMLGVPEQILRG